MSEGERRAIWEVGCYGIDVVLFTSFDWEDLANLDPFVGEAEKEHAREGSPSLCPERLVFAVAHRVCHAENPTSRRIQKRLDAMHRKSIDAIERMSPCEIRCLLARRFDERAADLPGLLWAMLSDPREEVSPYGLCFGQGLMLRAVKLWMARPTALVEP